MKLKYGSTELGDASWASIRWGRDLLRNAAGIGYGFLFTAECPEIGFKVAGQADADTKGAAIEAALAVGGGNLVLEKDNATASFKAVTSTNTFSGVRCVRGPVWSEESGAQHLTYLKYAAAFEWEISFGEGAPLLLSWNEAVSSSGGTPLTVVQEYLNAEPEAQQTIFRQKWVVTQQGSAVGYLAYPTPPAPGFANPNRQSVSKAAAQRVGASGYKGFRVDWSYMWEFAADPGSLTPNQWTG